MRWNILDEPVTFSPIDGLTIHPVLQRLLQRRGYASFDTAKAFFRPQLSDLHDPLLMKDMQKAVDRLHVAISQNQPILVLGDYDVDGTCSVAMFTLFLTAFTSEVQTYIPDRYKEGYGISYLAIDWAKSNGISLIVALDCGVKSVDQIAYANSLGIDFIICDHHMPDHEVPDAVAVLDPKQADCAYPYKELCGCGVGFKLIQAYYKAVGVDQSQAESFLDLVATAIAADIVPLTGENRILAYYGLQLLNARPRIGLQVLGFKIKHPVWKISDVVFQLAPRINAAGRIKHASLAVELLMSTDENHAQQLAEEIEVFNTERRALDTLTTTEALNMITSYEETDAVATVLADDNWHKGVIGIVASRLIETYYRPTIVFTKSEGVLAASARSVKGFDLYRALEACSSDLIQFGGHPFAAGMTILPENFEKFKAQFLTYTEKNWAIEDREPSLQIDSQMPISQIDEVFLRILHQFEPFGPGNSNPVFMDEFQLESHQVETMGKTNDHLRLQLFTSLPYRVAGVGFGLGHFAEALKKGTRFQLAYSLEENYFKGRIYTQIKIRDLRLR